SESDRKALRGGALLAALEEGADVVGRGHLRETTRCGKRGVAVAGGDVEHALASTQVDGLADTLSDDLERGADHGVVTGGPCRLLALLDGRVVGHGGDGSGEGGSGHGDCPLYGFYRCAGGTGPRHARGTAPSKRDRLRPPTRAGTA